jgi:hypothetical protein
MHAALKELDEEVGRQGLRASLPIALSYDPSPEVGLAARGADEAFRSLIEIGLLLRTGSMLEAGLAVDQQKLVRYRRRLMTLEPAAAALLQRAGSRWAALASTVAKKPAAAAESPAPTVELTAV